MEEIVKKILEDSLKVKKAFVRENTSKLILLAEKTAAAFTNDRKLMLAGNGGSAADAQHIAAEFVNRYTFARPPLPALALTTDSSVITSIGNDYTFNDIFSKKSKFFKNTGLLIAPYFYQCQWGGHYRPKTDRRSILFPEKL